MSDYAPPVDGLLAFGDARKMRGAWSDYVEQFGLTEDHVPELCRMITDAALWEINEDEDLNKPEIWGPVHAWRAIGQLKAEAAVEALIEAMRLGQGDDWTSSEMPRVLTMIGPVILPKLAEVLAQQGHEDREALLTAESILSIAEEYPDARQTCIQIATVQLEHYAQNHAIINAVMISILTKLKAKKTLKLIKRAFDSENVDEMWMGGWEDVQVEFGLLLKSPPKDHYLDPDQVEDTLDRQRENLNDRRRAAWEKRIRNLSKK